MKILILEDDRARIDKFREKLDVSGVSLTVTGIVSACIKSLELVKYNALFLDHDLDGKVYVPSEGPEPTGWHVAKWLNEHPDRQPPIIVIHTLNYMGRMKMKEQLPNALELPFIWEAIKCDGKRLDFQKLYNL